MKLSLKSRALSLTALALVAVSAQACSSAPNDPSSPSPEAPTPAGTATPAAADDATDTQTDVGYDDTASDDSEKMIAIDPAEEALGPDFVRAPHGGVHKSCFHALADGDVVQPDGSIVSTDGSVQKFEPCGFPLQKVHKTVAVDAEAAPGVQPPTDNGWTEDANWTSPVPIKHFSAQFHVPAAPKVYTNQLIYMFPAIEDIRGTSIVQPVLQYGNNGGWGGKYWSIASWLGGGQWGGHYYYSASRRVTTGEVISGVMYDNGNCHPAGCEWVVSMHNSKNTKNITVSGLSDLSWRWVFAGAIEVYGINSCAKYPATYDNFYSFSIKDYGNHAHTASWGHSINVHTCHEKITSNSKIANLYY